METMYDRIKRMDKHELAEFIYVIYQVGVKDGEQNLCDSPMGFFGCCYFLNDCLLYTSPSPRDQA